MQKTCGFSTDEKNSIYIYSKIAKRSYRELNENARINNIYIFKLNKS